MESDLYDIFYFDYIKDVPLYRKYADQCENVLELMCGTGRLPYHLNHPHMVGIDNNLQMLARAQENLRGRNVDCIEGDVRSFHMDEQFCLVIAAINSMTMFPKEERVAILKNVTATLRCGGRFIMDVINPYEMVEGIVHHGDTKVIEDKIYSRFFVPRHRDGYWNILYFYDIVSHGIIHRRVSDMNIYPIYTEDVHNEFNKVGLRIESIFGSYEMTDYDEEYSDKLIVVGIKDECD